MRQLSLNQRLIVVGEPKLFQEVRQIRQLHNQHKLFTKKIRLALPQAVDIKDVLLWIMHNTVQSIWKGLSMWAEQGLFFASGTDPQHAILNENIDLQRLYGSDLQPTSIFDHITASQDFHKKRTGGNDIQSMQNIAEQILDCTKTFGNGFNILRSGIDEECERELAREVEQEEEEELKVEIMTAGNERNWSYERIFEVDTPMKLEDIEILTLADAIRRWASHLNAKEFNWSKQIVCTQNFFVTIRDTSVGRLDEFLRIPDCFVKFPTGQILLLTDREAHFVLDHCKKSAFTLDEDHHLGHCAFQSDTRREYERLLQQSTRRITNFSALSPVDASTVKLFNGECSYPGPQRQALKEILRIIPTRLTDNAHNFRTHKPDDLVFARGKSQHYDTSDLERVFSEICTELETNPN